MGFCANGAHAIPLLTLQQTGQSITQGDKLFDNFSTTVTGTDLDAVDLALIDVVGYTSPGGEHGIAFRPLQGSNIIAVNPGLYVDLVLRFDVTVLNPALDIDGISMTFDASVPPQGHAQVVELVVPDQPAGDPAQAFVSANPDIPSAHIDLLGQHHQLHVFKDIAVIGGVDAPTAPDSTISEITQTFSQVPEPTTLVLLGLASVLLAGRRRSMGRMLVPALVSLVIVFAQTTAQAVPLSTLVSGGGQITEGDKRFENFEVTINQDIGATIFETSTLNVATRTEGEDVILAFEGLFGALSTIESGSILQVTIDFDVVVTDPAMRLSGLELLFNGQPLNPVDASASVVETVTSGGPLATLTVQNPGSLLDQVTLAAPPPAIQSAHVSKTITVNGGEASIATISVIEQRFSQVPEPATLAGLLIGSLLLPRRRRA